MSDSDDTGPAAPAGAGGCTIPYATCVDEEQQARDQEREDAQSFRHGEAEHETTELAIGRRRVAQGAREEAREDVAERESGAGHAEASETSADVTCSFRVHGNSFGWIVRG